MKKRAFQVVLTLIFSALALVIALRGISFEDVGTALARVNWFWIGATFVLILVTLVIRAARWRILLGRTVSLRDTFGLIGIGYLISGVLPLRAGDPARAVGASLRGPISAIAALSTVVVERVLDMLLIVLVLLATVPFVPGLQVYLATGQLNDFLSFNLVLTLSGVLAFGILLLFVLIAVFPTTTENLARRVLDWLPIANVDRWLRPVQNIVQGLSALRSAADGLAIGLWSLALWGVTGLYFGTTMWACRAFIPDPSALKSLVAVWSSAFGMVFPATGGIGSFHFAVREALYWGFSIARDLGFAYAVVVHALPYLTGIVFGALTLLLWGMSPRKLISRSQDIET
ncbi:MAG: flippase-like domain-containing protein [Anaerolineae bacterium]|nr:flippase-like domain-containing protein [Anaerolineae bacterium]